MAFVLYVSVFYGAVQPFLLSVLLDILEVLLRHKENKQKLPIVN